MSNISQYQLDEALEYFQYALDIAPDNTEQDLLQIAKIHSHMGGVFNDQKNIPKHFLFEKNISHLFIHY